MAKEYDNLFKILLVGSRHVGKSSIMTTLDTNTFQNSSYLPTIGLDFVIQTIHLDGKIVKMQIWDTAGSERFPSITRLYFRETAGVIIVFDVTDQYSFGNITFCCYLRLIRMNLIRTVSQWLKLPVGKE